GDLVVTDTGATVLLGNGDGTFAAPARFPTGPQPSALAVGDLNNDGRPDLAVGRFIDTVNAVAVLLGNGDGTVGGSTAVPVGAWPHGVAFGDVNGDGRADLAVAEYNARTVSISLGNGDGTFGARTAFAAGPGPVSVAVHDMNGDGAADLVVADNNNS